MLFQRVTQLLPAGRQPRIDGFQRSGPPVDLPRRVRSSDHRRGPANSERSSAAAPWSSPRSGIAEPQPNRVQSRCRRRTAARPRFRPAWTSRTRGGISEGHPVLRSTSGTGTGVEPSARMIRDCRSVAVQFRRDTRRGDLDDNRPACHRACIRQAGRAPARGRSCATPCGASRTVS